MSKIIKYVRIQSSPIVINHALAAPDIKASLALDTTQSAASKREAMLNQAYLEKEEILQEARSQAAAIVKQAEADSEQILRQAHQQGYQQGYQQGRQQGLDDAQREAQSMLAEAAAKAQRLQTLANEEYRERILASERQIVEIALAVAQKILNREIADNPVTVLPIARAALEKVQDQDQITILVNPDDYELVLQAKRDLQMLVGRERALTVAADAAISPGGCSIDTPCGTVDARIDTQLAIIRKSLQEILP